MDERRASLAIGLGFAAFVAVVAVINGYSGYCLGRDCEQERAVAAEAEVQRLREKIASLENQLLETEMGEDR